VKDVPPEQHQSIFVTGAASGIGRATARLFAQRGWLVGCFDVNEQGLEQLKAELGAAPALFRPLDVTDRTDVLAAFEEFGRSSGGRLDLLFNNAGIDAKGSFASMAWEQAMAVVNVNFVGGLSVIHAGLPLLRATDNALCLSTASASAIFGTATLAVYSATKHAVRGLTEALSVEFAAYGVRAMDILPGIIDTGMLSAEDKAFLPSEGMWRALPAEEVAALVWEAYHGNKLHWYIPAELAALDVRVTTNPEAVRDDFIAGRPL
jgi:NAD(P)-dependent dehydrogenase (short-subunit alcohol dehydrogenase family)